MTSKLAFSIGDSHINPAERDVFFFPDDLKKILNTYNKREKIRNPLNSCDTNLFMGVFFDGTGNNFEDSLNRQDYSYSNVARLYSAYPGLSVRGYAATPTFMTKDLT